MKDVAKGMIDFDVIVVGGGPAGTTSALECSKLGLRVLLIERGSRGRHKPCGGVLPPACVNVIRGAFGRDIPRSVICSPETLGLYYVPPSGRKNGGCMRNYRLLNINRDLFDQWLRNLAEKSGVQVWYGTEFLKLRLSEPIQVLTKKDEDTLRVTTRYLIGADGVYSRVRRELYGRTKIRTLPVLQEHWKAEGDFDDYFYAFFRGAVSPTYAYVIPKNGLYLVGVGVPETHLASISTAINRFKEWLVEEFAFKASLLERQEAWAIPYGFVFEGRGNVILVGDATGFCNSLSGEGIRLAIESSVAAGSALQEAISYDRPFATTYIEHANWIASFVRQIYQFVTSLTDEDREEFVKSELARISFLEEL